MAGQLSDSVAIVGMSCRFPGGANSPEQLWKMISEGRSAWSNVPSDRWKENSFYHPCPDTNGTSNHRGGHFLDQDISTFDAGFFGIPPSEAYAMDPQQRIQLESAYEALEDAGIPLVQIRGSDTAVYVAVFSHDYDHMMYKDTSDMARYHMTGLGQAIISNRISHAFDLRGPSFTLDTGCSGSMVALHQACLSLRTGESKMALVGGVNLILSSDLMIPMSLLHVLNDNGRCYAFDSRGDGYGRGEGVATIVLKPLADAIQAGDNVRAVIRGTGVNQDGKTPGIAVPNQIAQQDLIRSLYRSTGIDLDAVGYVEAHGTGTVTGDTIEANSIVNAFCEGRKRDSPLFVGSIKTNIGHLESASGIAGLIKTVLILEKGQIPPNLNLEQLKPHLSLDEWNVEVPRALECWAVGPTGERLASVNSFGYGGTNGHAILQSAPLNLPNALINGNSNEHETAGQDFIQKRAIHGLKLANGERINYSSTKIIVNGDGNYNTNLMKTLKPLANHLGERTVFDTALAVEQEGSPTLLVVTANSDGSLQKMVENLKSWVLDHELDEAGLKNLAYTLCSRRSIMQWRRSFIVGSHKALLLSLDQNASRARKASDDVRVAFVFTGQGAQWFAMGRELITSESCFRDSLVASDRILKSFGASWSLIEELLLDEAISRVNQSDIAQPATTALQIALTDVLNSLGVRPSAVLGHSSGEIAAAYAAGALSQNMALKVSYHRSLVVNTLVQNRQGAMLAVGLDEKEVLGYISHTRRGVLSVACVNGPSSTTISGDEAAISEVSDLLDSKHIFNKRLRVDTAYHSHHMLKIADKYFQSLKGLEAGIPHSSVKFISSVTANEKRSNFGPPYWVENLVSKVRFSEALGKLCQDQQESSQHRIIPCEHIYVEVGPHSALSGPIRQTIMALKGLDSFRYSYFPSLVRGRDAIQCVLELVGKLFERGCPIRLEATHTLEATRRSFVVMHDLPTYPWDHLTRYWHEPRISKEHRLRDHPHHDLLGLRVVGSTLYEPSWRNILCEESLPWLCDHVVDGFVIFPGSGYLCMAIEAMKQILFDRQVTGTIARFIFKDVFFWKALTIPASHAKVEIQLSLRSTPNPSDRNSATWEEFRVSSVSEDGRWHEHCRGSIAVDMETEVDEVESLRNEHEKPIDHKSILVNVTNACSETLGSDGLYNECRGNGNMYGSTFTNLDKIHIGVRQAVGTVVTPDVAACMPSHFLQPHTIHPSTLDSIFHLNIPLYLRHCSRGSIMPVSIDELVISAKVGSDPGKKFQVLTLFTPDGPRSATAETSAFQQESSETAPVITILGVELRGLGDAQNVASDSGMTRNITYRLEWGPDVTNYSPVKLNYTEDACELERRGITPEEKEKLLLRAALLYMNCSLNELATQDLDVPEKHHLLLVKWLKDYRKSEAYQDLVGSMTSSEIEQTLEQVRQLDVEGETMTRVGKNMTKILTGQVEPLAILLEDNLLYRLYGDDSSFRCYSHLIDYLKRLSFKRPNMNVLEIGAGTGGMTVQLLRAHDVNQSSFFKHYDYTDISSGFFEQARQVLLQWAGLVRMKTLDIERDPIGQGFEEASYDLIVASNVIHATSYLDKTMANVKRLLKPGGKLALIEITNLTPFHMMIFGLLPGWWKGFDDGRTQGPLLSVKHWDAVLSRCSFRGVELEADDLKGPAQRSSLMISGLEFRDEKIPLPFVRIIHDPILEFNSIDLRRDLFSGLETKGFQPIFIPWPSGRIDETVIYIVLDLNETALLAEPSSEEFNKITALLTQNARILWISCQQNQLPSKNSEKGLVAGFCSVARAENEKLQVVTFDIQHCNSSEYSGLVQVISDILLNSFCSSPGREEGTNDYEYTYRDGQLLIPRLKPDYKINSRVVRTDDRLKIEMLPFFQQDRPLKLSVQKPGLLDSLVFNDDKISQMPLSPNELEIQVAACGVNFKDVFVALGQMKASTQMAGECAGVITAVGSDIQDRFFVGERVCAFDATPYASKARVNGTNAHRIPVLMDFPTAASIPAVFSTAYHSLVNVARLQKGQTILIHAASGGVGQAALRIAQHIGAEIFATVGSAAKRALLVEQYKIEENHIFSSRTRNFKTGIDRLTDGNGVDVILNSLSGEALHDTWSCIAKFGTFVEIGKSDIYKKSRIRMEPFDKNVTFASVDLSLLSQHRPAIIQELLASVMKMFEAGEITSVQPITKLPMSEIEQAFRLIQGRKHTGKIILDAESEDPVKVVSAKELPLSLEKNGCYMIAGGLGDLGLHIARFMAARGAGHIILLSRRTLCIRKQSIISRELELLGAKVHIMTCDIGDLSTVMKCINQCGDQLPPLRGIIQAAMVLQDRLLDRMTVEDYKAALLPKVHGTKNLHEATKSLKLEFFVTLSSLAGILGSKGQANYAAGNSFQDYLVNSERDADTNYVSLSLGMIEDSEVITLHPERIPGLIRMGCIPFKIKQFLGLLEYSLSPQGRKECNQVVIGIDRKSISDQGNTFLLNNAMLSHLPDISSNQTQRNATPQVSRKVDQLLIKAQGFEEIRGVISAAIAEKIAALMAIEPERIDLEIPLAELGFDSLIAIELKNWIGRTLKAAIQTSEIFDTRSITALTTLIAERSTLVRAENRSCSHVNNFEKKELPDERVSNSWDTQRPLPTRLSSLPLLDLESVLQLYFNAICSFCSKDELAEVEKAVEEFLEPGNVGQMLQNRLLQRVNDPLIDGWQYDLYNAHVYAKCRAPVNPFQHVGFCFKTDIVLHGQAEQAAIISLSAFQFKQRLEASEVEPDYLNEQALCMDSLQWLFNTHREPGIGIDNVRKCPENDYMVVMRHGHFFKVMLKEGRDNVSFATLKDTLQTILDTPTEDLSSVAALTADERNNWTKVRDIVREADLKNRATMDLIEASAFIVCLDDASPNNPTERLNQILLGSISNRWSDKTLQFVVCKNGVSGGVIEHSMIDGGGLEKLFESISKAVKEHQPSEQRKRTESNFSEKYRLDEQTFVITPAIEGHIGRVQEQFNNLGLLAEAAHYTCTQFGSTFLRRHNCAPKAGYQLVIQLASRLYFGYQPPCWETVSMRTFRKGRVDILQVVLPQVAEFCSSVFDDKISPQTRRAQFFEAAKAYTINLSGVSRGRGFAGHLYALQEVLRDGEKLPSLFTHPTYSRTRPSKIMTDSTIWSGTIIQEACWVMPDPEHVWVHYEVGDEKCEVFIKGPPGRTQEFFALMEKAARAVKELLEGSEGEESN